MSDIMMCLSTISFIISALLFLSANVYGQIFRYSNGNVIREGIVFSIFFLISVFTLITGIALKCVAKDVKNELDCIRKEFDEKIKT